MDWLFAVIVYLFFVILSLRAFHFMSEIDRDIERAGTSASSETKEAMLG